MKLLLHFTKLTEISLTSRRQKKTLARIGDHQLADQIIHGGARGPEPLLAIPVSIE